MNPADTRCSCGHPDPWHCGQPRFAPEEPRYTVELTTEGWQIKDNERNALLADAFGSKTKATKQADLRNEAEAAGYVAPKS